jgi:hypothetical protein
MVNSFQASILYIHTILCFWIFCLLHMVMEG